EKVRVFSTTAMTEVRITVNGQPRAAAAGSSVAALLATMGVDPARVAIERNEEVVPRKTWSEAVLREGDKIEIVSFVGGGSDASDDLVLAGKRFKSRLLIGTGKYKSIEETRKALELSGAEIVTVALRRV